MDLQPTDQPTDCLPVTACCTAQHSTAQHGGTTRPPWQPYKHPPDHELQTNDYKHVQHTAQHR